MSFNAPSAARLKAALTSSAEAALPTCVTKSVMEPSGTRRAVLSFPGPDVLLSDERTNPWLAFFGEGPHVHDDRLSHEVFRRYPIPSLGAEWSRQGQPGT